MNQQLISLAASIQQQIQQLTSSAFSELDKDVLLDDLRQLYRMIQKVETNIQTTEKKFSPEQAFPRVQPSYIHSTIENRVEETSENKKDIRFSIGIEEDTSPSAECGAPIEEIISDILHERHSPELPVNTISTLQQRDANPTTEKTPDVLVSKDAPPLDKENLQQSKESSIGIGGNTVPSLNEVFTKKEISINESAVSAPVKELHQLIAEKSSVTALLDFNSRILLTRELFNGNSENCHIFLKELEKCKDLDTAKSLVNTTALSKGWKSDNEAVKILVSLVRKVYS